MLSKTATRQALQSHPATACRNMATASRGNEPCRFPAPQLFTLHHTVRRELPPPKRSLVPYLRVSLEHFFPAARGLGFSWHHESTTSVMHKAATVASTSTVFIFATSAATEKKFQKQSGVILSLQKRADYMTSHPPVTLPCFLNKCVTGAVQTECTRDCRCRSQATT